jgi:hypothetical protein
VWLSLIMSILCSFLWYSYYYTVLLLVVVVVEVVVAAIAAALWILWLVCGLSIPIATSLLVMACRTHFQNFFVCSNIETGSSDMQFFVHLSSFFCIICPNLISPFLPVLYIIFSIHVLFLHTSLWF